MNPLLFRRKRIFCAPSDGQATTIAMGFKPIAIVVAETVVSLPPRSQNSAHYSKRYNAIEPVNENMFPAAQLKQAVYSYG
ncbi:hypothetical protein ACVW2L_001148 [Mucilaginibacter sp. HD30]